MAVLDTYVGSEFTPAGGSALTQTVAAGTRAAASQSKGSKIIVAHAHFEVAAGDDDASVFRLFKGLPSTLKPIEIIVMCDALTNGTDWDLGFYPTNGKTIGSSADGDKDILMDGQTLASASRVLNGMSAVDLPDIGVKSIADLLGHSVEAGTDKGFYDMALTANTIGTVAGSVAVFAKFLSED